MPLKLMAEIGEVESIERILGFKEETGELRVKKIKESTRHIVASNFYPFIDTIFDISEGKVPRGYEKAPENSQEHYVRGEILEAYLQEVLIKYNKKEEDSLESEIEDKKIGDETYYLKKLMENRFLNIDEEVFFMKRIKEGDERAKEIFLKANQRLVAKIAFQFKKDWSSLNLDLFDLISEGNAHGLCPAIDGFKPERGNKFSTYATWSIRNAMINFCYKQGNFIRINRKYFSSAVLPVRDVIRRYVQEKGREPTFDEIAVETGIDRKKVINAYQISQAPVKCERIEDEGKRELEADFNKLNPRYKEDMQIFEEMREEVTGYLKKVLNPREVVVISKRFGIGEHHPLTQPEIAGMFGVAKQRIWEIEKNAMKKLLEKRGEFNGNKDGLMELLRDFSILRQKLFD